MCAVASIAIKSIVAWLSLCQVNPPDLITRYSFRHNLDDVAARVAKLRADLSVDPETSDFLFGRIGKLQVRSRLLDNARLTLPLIEDDGVRMELLASIARAYAKRGDVEICQTLIADSPDNGSQVDNWRFSICSVVVEEMCGQLRFKDAVDIAMLQDSDTNKQLLLTDVADRAAESGASSVLEAILPYLRPLQQCQVLMIIAMKSIDSSVPEAGVRGQLDRVVSILPKIQPIQNQWSILQNLCVCFDALDEAKVADQLMSQISDATRRAHCAMNRAENHARRRRFTEVNRNVDISRRLNSEVSILAVLQQTVRAGESEAALRLARKYCSPEALAGYLVEGILEPALEMGDIDSALIASRLLPSALERADGLLRSARTIAERDSDKTYSTFKIRKVLAETEGLAHQIEQRSAQIRAIAEIAMIWHRIGDEASCKRLLHPLVDMVLNENELRGEWNTCLQLLNALSAAEMTKEMNGILSLFDMSIDALRWRIDRLCEQRRFSNALDAISKSKASGAVMLRKDVLRKAAQAGSVEWALDQSNSLDGNERTKLERTIVVLEEMAERITH